MKKINFILGSSDRFADKSEIIQGSAVTLSDSEFVIKDFSITLVTSIISTHDYRREIMEQAGNCGSGTFIKSVAGFAHVWADDSEKTVVGELALLAFAKAVALARGGMPAAALKQMVLYGLNTSWRLGLEKLLQPEVRANLLVELLYGTHKLGNICNLDYSLLCSCEYWGLQECEPRAFLNSGKFYLHAAGLGFNGRINNLQGLKPGLELVLEQEPHNRYDPQAVHIWTANGGDLGYVPRGIASTIAFGLRNGKQYLTRLAVVDEDCGEDYLKISVEVTRQ